MDTFVEDVGTALDIFAFALFVILSLGLIATTKQLQLLDGFVGITGIGCNFIGVIF